MGKYLDEEYENKQVGCMWGIAHVLDYHHWHSNVRKMIPHRKFQACDWSPDMSVDGRDGYERLLSEQESPQHSKSPRGTKRRSLRSRFKAMISEEAPVEGKDSQGRSGFSAKSSLQRTYSIHHLQSVDDFFGKIRKDWDHPIIFLPRNSEDDHMKSDSSRVECSDDKHDVLEVFEVDKDLLMKQLQDSDKGVASFSRKFSKSRSFPVADLAERVKLKPLKLESKQKEVWSSIKKYREEENTVDTSRKRTHRRSSSLGESTIDKYSRLFENSSGKDVQLSTSKSLKLMNENGVAPLYFKRVRSLSRPDSYYCDVNFEVLLGENRPEIAAEGNSLSTHRVVEEETMPVELNVEIEEDDANLRLHTTSNETDHLKETAAYCSDVSLEGAQDQCFVSGSNDFFHNTESPAVELHIPKGKEHASRTHTKELDYVRCLLEKSGIAVDASEVAWHASDQLFSPRLIEEVEGGWPHEEDDELGHQMLFDVVNEVLLELYDISLPYYPKALSSSCYIRPFPVGGRVVEEVCTSIGTLVDVKPEERQLLDSIVGRDLARDRGWMNLQLESEAIALDLEDMIFEELLQEVFS